MNGNLYKGLVINIIYLTWGIWAAHRAVSSGTPGCVIELDQKAFSGFKASESIRLVRQDET